MAAPAALLLLAACTALDAAPVGDTDPAAPASGGTPTEYEVKAAYLYKFIRFAEWSPAAFDGATEGVFVVTVLGDDPFGPALEETFRGKEAYGRKLVVRRTRSPEEAAKSQLVFVSAAMIDALPDLVQAVDGRGVLVVCDTPECARRGAAIGFRLDEHRVRFDINPVNAESRGLRLSSQLLRVARIVPPDPSKKEP